MVSYLLPIPQQFCYVWDFIWYESTLQQMSNIHWRVESEVAIEFSLIMIWVSLIDLIDVDNWVNPFFALDLF